MYRSRTKFGTKAQTIGVLLDCPGGPYQSAVLSGVAETARNLEANILCFALGVQRDRPEGAVGRRFVQKLVGPHNLDGAILFSSTLTDETGVPGLARLARSYTGLRVCSLGVDLEGFPSVTVDNRAGIREAVAHLARDHRLQRIAFICGPEGNAEADARREAYQTELGAQGIPSDPKLLLPGNFLEDAGKAAIRTLAQRPGFLESLGAIVACNDQMAIGALGELEKMNVRVPESIAVVGFDDIEESRFSHPALTTVRQPLARLGGQAVRCVVDITGRREPAASVELKAELIRRRSCGCAGEFKAARTSIPPAPTPSFDSALLQHRQRIVNKLARAAGGLFAAAGPGWDGKLLTALVSDLQSEQASEFARGVEILAEKLLSAGVDLNLFDHVLSVLRHETLPLLRGNPKYRDRAEESFHLCRLTTSSLIQRGLNRERFRLGLWTRTTAFVCNSLATAFDYAQLKARIKNELPRLGIRSCFVSLYEPASEPLTARLFAAYDTTQPREWPEGTLFRANMLLPPGLVESEQEGSSFAVLPLTCGNELLGHIMLDFEVTHIFAHEALAQAIGGGLYGAKLAGSAVV